MWQSIHILFNNIQKCKNTASHFGRRTTTQRPWQQCQILNLARPWCGRKWLSLRTTPVVPSSQGAQKKTTNKILGRNGYDITRNHIIGHLIFGYCCFFFWEFMHVKGHAMFKFRCFWNCSFIAHMFLAWFLQSWKLARFFIVTGWPMILISFKMSGAQFTLIMASSHQSISFFFGWKYMGVTLENLDAAAILSHQHLWSVGDFQTFWSSKIAYWL